MSVTSVVFFFARNSKKNAKNDLFEVSYSVDLNKNFFVLRIRMLITDLQHFAFSFFALFIGP